MSDSSFPLTITRKITLLIFLWYAAIASAQAPRPTSNPSSSTDDSHSSKQGSHSSLTLIHQQSVIQCMELARAAIRRTDYLAALSLMERMLSESNSFVPTGDSTEVSAHEEVRRLLRQIPTELRQRLDDQRRTLSLRAWEDARVNGIAEVAAFIQQFGDLPLGVDAWWWLGSHERDHSRKRMAAAAFGRMAEHRYANKQQRAIARLAQIESLVDAAQLSEAILAEERLAEFDSTLVVQIDGRPMKLAQWQSDHRINLASRIPLESTPSFSAGSRDRLRRPVSLPAWKHLFKVPLTTNLNAHEEKQRLQGIRPIPITKPVAVGDQVIVRMLDAIHALSQSTGDLRWTIANTEYREIDRLKLLDNAANHAIAVEWAQRRTDADSIFSGMSTDGQRLFVVQEPDRTRNSRVDREFPRGLFRNGPRYNKLCGYSLVTGALEWEIGGDATGASDTFGGCFFLGCPLDVDDVLYVVAQRETQLQLLAIEPENGSLVWSVNIGATSLPIAEDLQRSRVACPIVWDEGLLLCSTSAGAVIAIDPLLRSLKWGYRYPATTISVDDLNLGQDSSDNRRIDREPWWDLWREPFAAVHKADSTAADVERETSISSQSRRSTLIFASPESDELHAIDLSDGGSLWRVARGGGLMIAGIAEDLVVVIEGDFVRAHDVLTGRQRWRTMTGEISGRGAFAGSILVLPAQLGGTILLNVRDGKLLSDSSNSDSPLGALIDVDTGWIASNRHSVMRLPRLDGVRHGVELQLKNEPDNESLRVRAAFLDLQAGDFVAARGRLDGLQSTPARDLRREALIDALREPDPNRSDADRSDLVRQLKEFAEDVDSKFAAGAAIGTSALASDDLIAVVDAALDGLAEDLELSETLVKKSSVAVRKDRVLLGLIDEAYRRAKPNEIPAMNELFLNRLKEARKSRDRFAVQRLAQQWRGLDWGRRVTAMEDDKVFRKRAAGDHSLTKIELRLLDAAGSNDTSIGIQALDKLAQRFDRANAAQDAKEVRRRMLRELPTAKFPDGTTESERIDRDAHLREAVYAKTASLWPAVEPELESRDERNFGGFPIVPMLAEPGSLAERLDVLVDRNDSYVLFRGESFSHSGQDEEHERKITLPPTASPFRGSAGYMLRRGWGVGRIVILLVGTELFAISPIDDRGEPDPRFLWSSPIELQSSDGDTRVIAGRAGANDGEHLAVDQMNRQIGKVGPVRAGYLCYQKGSKLVAVETETGHELWERLDLPKNTTVLGDDHCVFLWRKNHVLEVLSAIDGRNIEDRVWPRSPASMIHQHGSLVWTATRGADFRTELHDLRTGELKWSRVDPKDSHIAVLDSATLGIATSDDHLHLLAARSGNPLCDPLDVDARALDGIVVWSDIERWYVALNRSTEDLAKLKSVQSNVSYRLPFFRGTLYALDRDQPKILWRRELKDEPIALDQSKVAPVLVQLWKLIPKDGLSTGQGALTLIDKRTGRNLPLPAAGAGQRQADLQSYFRLNPDPQQGIVELRLARETILIRYAAEPPADADNTK